MYETMILRLVCYGWEQTSQSPRGSMGFRKGSWRAFVHVDFNWITFYRSETA